MADTTVTGQFGRENVSLNNAASEATLLKLLAAMERMGGGRGDAERTRKLAQESQSAQSNYNKQVGAGSKALEASNKAMQGFARSLGNLSSKMLSFSGSILSSSFTALKGLTSEVLIGGNRISDFTQHISNIPILGLVDPLAKFMDQTVAQLNELGQSGAGFNNSILEMRRAAANSAMDLDMFNRFVKANSQTMAMFGGTATEGAKRLGVLSKEFRESDAGKRLIEMGYGVEGTNEVFANFVEITSKSNRQTLMDRETLMQSASAYALELDKLIKLTGMTRKQAEDSMKAQAEDLKVRLLLNRIKDPTMRATAEANMVFIKEQFKGLGPLMMDLIGDGIPNISDTKFLMMLDQKGNLRNLLTQASQGLISQEEFKTRMAEMYPELEAALNKMVNLGNIDAITASSTLAGLRTVGNNLFEFSRIVKGASSATEGSKDEPGNLTKTFRTFEQTIIDARTKIQGAFLDSQLFEKIAASTNALMSTENITALTDNIVKGTKTALDRIDGFVNDIKTMGWSAAIEKQMEILKQDVTKFIQDLFGLDTRKPLKEELVRVGKEFIKEIFGIDKNKSLSDEIARMTKEWFANLLGTTATNSDGSVKSVGGIMADAYMTALKNHPEWTIIGTAFAGLIVGALGKKLLDLFKRGSPLSIDDRIEPDIDVDRRRPPRGGPVPTPRGGRSPWIVGAITALAGVAGLAALGGSLTVIADAFDKLDDIKWENIEKGLGTGAIVVGGAGVVAGLIALTGPIGILKTLGAAGVIGALGLALQPWATAANTAADAADKYARSLGNLMDKFEVSKQRQQAYENERLQNLLGMKPEDIQKAANSIDSLQKAIGGFNPTLWKSISSGIGSLFSKTTSDSIVELANNGPGLQAASAGIASISTALKDFNWNKMSLTDDQARGIQRLSTVSFSGLDRLAAVQVNDFARNVDTLGRMKAVVKDLDFSKLQFTTAQQKDLETSVNHTMKIATNLANIRTNADALGRLNLGNFRSNLTIIADSIKQFTDGAEKMLGIFNRITENSPIAQLKTANDTLRIIQGQMNDMVVNTATTATATQSIDTKTVRQAQTGTVRR